MPSPVRTLEKQDICRGNYTDPGNPKRHCAIGWVREFSKDTTVGSRYHKVLDDLLLAIRTKNNLEGIALWNDHSPVDEVVDTLNKVLLPYKGELL